MSHAGLSQQDHSRESDFRLPAQHGELGGGWSEECRGFRG